MRIARESTGPAVGCRRRQGNRSGLVSPVVCPSGAAVFHDHLRHDGPAQPAADLIGCGGQRPEHRARVRALRDGVGDGLDLRSPGAAVEGEQLCCGQPGVGRRRTGRCRVLELDRYGAVCGKGLSKAHDGKLDTTIGPSRLYVCLPGRDGAAADDVRRRIMRDLSRRKPASDGERPDGLGRGGGLVDRHRVAQCADIGIGSCHRPQRAHCDVLGVRGSSQRSRKSAKHIRRVCHRGVNGNHRSRVVPAARRADRPPY